MTQNILTFIIGLYDAHTGSVAFSLKEMEKSQHCALTVQHNTGSSLVTLHKDSA